MALKQSQDRDPLPGADRKLPVADAPDTWRTPHHRWAILLEKIALAFERPVNKLIGTSQLNPLYHTGTIATYLLVIVGLTGLYLFFFFQYGFDASYNAVARMEGQLIARLIRAIHRYASGALVITTLLHGYRTLFMERFRGARWLAWVSGFVMTVLVWGAGVTGYWMIWDQRSQLITDGFLRLLGKTTPFAPNLIAYLTSVEGTPLSWPFLLILLVIHVLLFLIVAGFFWLHILRLRRPRWYPEVHWVVGLGVVLVLVSVFFPAGMLPQANLSQLPDTLPIDPFFLFYLPFSGTPASIVLWSGLSLVTVGLTLLPWLSKAKRPSPITTPPPRVAIIDEKCTGCTLCAVDCPYKAIEMVELPEGKPHKYIAVAKPELCVSCGICVGSCAFDAITLGTTPPALLWDMVEGKLALAKAKTPDADVKLIFTCERHASQGAQPYLNGTTQNGTAVEIITMPCVGAAPPGLMTRALDAGAAEVQVVGCPPADCINREGNLWEEQRVVRERVPRLKRPYANAPVTALWLSPDTFSQAVTVPAPPAPDEERLERRRMILPISGKNVSISFLLLAVVMVVQVLFTNIPINPYPDRPAMAQAILANPSLAFERFEGDTAVSNPILFTFTVDGDPLYTQTIDPTDLRSPEPEPIVAKQELTPGSHHITLSFDDGQRPFILFDRTVDIAPGQVFRMDYDPNRTGDCYGTTCLKVIPSHEKSR
ncbi:MAG: hydrogenase iron-sulfur subunit [Ardenticatenaceae bacterium]|nr:hydrogenase iron-sulfur subunit [Anaerolineales bacterium]MCB8923598.1 hydrogenase iron-sulfur subunit [Ardenticatenaceae bacterium]MCB9003538.1 hydrogenase iron-sulfur subunit [Ardenticatenaceae bacterium]